VRGIVRALVAATLVGLAFALLRRLVGKKESVPTEPTPSELRPVPLHRRIPLVLVPAGLVAGGVFAIVVAVPRMAAAQSPGPPTQPIAFDHRVHTQAAGLDCAFCHRSAANGVTAGLPDVQLCMGCHQTVGQGQPEIDKVRMAWNRQQSIDWQLVHRLPDHTRFPHDAHIQAGIDCATCHGDVSHMSQVVQVRSLKMADCVACHQQHNAPTDCSVCHY
jgi:class III cytochrome C family protein/cytochrome c7-like protein